MQVCYALHGIDGQRHAAPGTAQWLESERRRHHADGATPAHLGYLEDDVTRLRFMTRRGLREAVVTRVDARAVPQPGIGDTGRLLTVYHEMAPEI